MYDKSSGEPGMEKAYFEERRGILNFAKTTY